MRKLTVLVADDHPLMLEAIRIALAESPEFEVAGETASGADVVVLAQRLQPDLILLDLSLPEVDGLEVLRALRRSASTAQVVVLSAHEEPATVDAAFREGASAFISKRIDPGELSAALRQALDPTLFQPLRMNPLADGAGNGDLNERELDALHALADGLSNKEIAQKLWLTEQTVKFHLSSVYRKLGVSSRTEAVAAAYERGIHHTPRLAPPADPDTTELAG